jgi:hypothetical protein
MHSKSQNEFRIVYIKIHLSHFQNEIIKELQSLRSSLLLCTADGVALGAAATTDQAGVEMIVFIAIMLHKVP